MEGTFTVKAREGVEHRTFRVSKGDDGTLFYSLLTGPNNERDFKCIAFQKPGFAQPRLTKAHQNIDKNGLTFRMFTYLTNATPEQAKACGVRWAKESGKCFVCGRKLTTPESIEAGIGPICEDKF